MTTRPETSPAMQILQNPQGYGNTGTTCAPQELLSRAISLLRRTQPRHYTGLTIDSDIVAFLAEVDQTSAQTIP